MSAWRRRNEIDLMIIRMPPGEYTWSFEPSERDLEIHINPRDALRDEAGERARDAHLYSEGREDEMKKPEDWK